MTLRIAYKKKEDRSSRVQVLKERLLEKWAAKKAKKQKPNKTPPL